MNRRCICRRLQLGILDIAFVHKGLEVTEKDSVSGSAREVDARVVTERSQRRTYSTGGFNPRSPYPLQVIIALEFSQHPARWNMPRRLRPEGCLFLSLLNSSDTILPAHQRTQKELRAD